MLKFKTQGIILMYHRIADVPVDPWDLCVSPANFEAQMKMLSQFGVVMSTDELASAPKRWRGSRFNIGVTFDDGYADNFHAARPILERHRVPATFFIVSSMIGQRQEFWWDHLERLIMQSEQLPATITFSTKSWDTARYPQRMELYVALWKELSPLTADERDRAVAVIESQIKSPHPVRGSYLPMTEDELVNLSRCKLFEIGSHTARHPFMARLNTADQQSEVLESQKVLETLTGPIRSFSCPHGSFTSDTIRLIKEAGFSSMYTSRDANVTTDQERFSLPRRVVGNWTAQEFERHMKGWMKN